MTDKRLRSQDNTTISFLSCGSQGQQNVQCIQQHNAITRHRFAVIWLIFVPDSTSLMLGRVNPLRVEGAIERMNPASKK